MPKSETLLSEILYLDNLTTPKHLTTKTLDDNEYANEQIHLLVEVFPTVTYALL